MRINEKNPGPSLSEFFLSSEWRWHINLRINLRIFNLHENWRFEDGASWNLRRYEDLKINSWKIFEDLKVWRSVLEIPSWRCSIFEIFFNRIFKSSNIRRFTFIRPVLYCTGIDSPSILSSNINRESYSKNRNGNRTGKKFTEAATIKEFDCGLTSPTSQVASRGCCCIFYKYQVSETFFNLHLWWLSTDSRSQQFSLRWEGNKPCNQVVGNHH